MSYDNTNTGALYKNDKEGNAKRPDYRGKLNVEGREYWVSAWIKENQGVTGGKFMSLSMEPKESQPQQSRPPVQPEREMPDGDDIPF